MIWLKRIAPFVIIIGLYFGYQFYNDNRIAKKTLEEDKYALVTAQLWVASAKYRLEPDIFIKYRDSILQDNDLDSARVFHFIDSYREQAEELGEFSSKIKIYVDSLVMIEDSILGIDRGDTVSIK